MTGYFNFDNNPQGPGAGIPVNLHIPAYCRIYGFFFTMKTTLTSTGGNSAGLAIQYIQSNSLTPVQGNLLPMTGITAFGNNIPIRPVNLFANPIQLLFPADIIMRIFSETMTGGSFQFDIWCSQNEIV